MKKSGRLGLIVVLAASMVLATAGAITAYQEFNVFVAGGISPASRFVALAGGAYRPGPSLLSKRLLLDTCLEAISGLYGRLQTAADRRAVLVRCLSEADTIVAGAPSFSYAWYIGALSAARLGDIAGFNTRMLRSQSSGPNEQWVAELRAELVEDHLEAATPTVLARHQADLRLLVSSRRGIAAISRRYVAVPGFRERIARIVETMPEADQARFVATVRGAAGSVARP